MESLFQKLIEQERQRANQLERENAQLKELLRQSGIEIPDLNE